MVAWENLFPIFDHSNNVFLGSFLLITFLFSIFKSNRRHKKFDWISRRREKLFDYILLLFRLMKPLCLIAFCILENLHHKCHVSLESKRLLHIVIRWRSSFALSSRSYFNSFSNLADPLSLTMILYVHAYTHTHTRKNGVRYKSNAVPSHSHRGGGSIGIRSAIQFSEVHDERRFNRAA